MAEQATEEVRAEAARGHRRRDVSRARWGSLAAIGLLVALELVLRGFGYGYRPRMRTSERFGVELLPSQTVLMPNSNVPLHVNDRGFRGEGWDDPTVGPGGEPCRDPSVLRVAVLGHSVTIGGWEDEHETYCGVLAEQLGAALARGGDDRRVLVMNFAGPAHTLASMQATFEDRVRPYRPDYLVVPTLAVDVRPAQAVVDAPVRPLRDFYVGTAIYDWIARRRGESHIDQPVLTDSEAARWRRVDELVQDVQADPFAREHRRFWDAMYVRLESIRAQQAADGGRTVLLSLVDPRDLAPPRATWTPIAQSNERWATGRRALITVDPLERFAAAMAPLLAEFERLGVRPQEAMAKYRRDTSLELEHRSASPFLFFSPGHLTRLGHRLVGEALCEALVADLAATPD